MADRREYGTGSLYQRTSDWRWIGTIEAGWNANGSRRRVPVSAKGCVDGCPPRCKHRAEIRRRLRDKQREIETDGLPTTSGSASVKRWADQWLTMKRTELRPKAYNAAASPVRKWIVPTIGHRRLDLLTPADVRAVHQACRAAGRSSADVHRVLINLLRSAVAEGHAVPQRVLTVKAPATAPSDRAALTADETVAALQVASTLPHGTRWAVALLYGVRQGECLGLVEDCIDFDARVIRLEWQLQALPYVVPRDRSSGFRVPDGFEARRLVDSWHLVRPKSRKGVRVLPLIPPMETALREWLNVRPANPWGLVWPAADGTPANPKADLIEWQGLQSVAEVGHPAGRYYYVHECRNVAATLLDDEGASDSVITSLLGHASIVTSRGYMTAHDAAKREAVARVAARLQLR